MCVCTVCMYKVCMYCMYVCTVCKVLIYLSVPWKQVSLFYSFFSRNVSWFKDVIFLLKNKTKIYIIIIIIHYWCIKCDEAEGSKYHKNEATMPLL